VRRRFGGDVNDETPRTSVAERAASPAGRWWRFRDGLVRRQPVTEVETRRLSVGVGGLTVVSASKHRRGKGPVDGTFHSRHSSLPSQRQPGPAPKVQRGRIERSGFGTSRLYCHRVMPSLAVLLTRYSIRSIIRGPYLSPYHGGCGARGKPAV